VIPVFLTDRMSLKNLFLQEFNYCNLELLGTIKEEIARHIEINPIYGRDIWEEGPLIDQSCQAAWLIIHEPIKSHYYMH